ncbi:MAG: 1,4-alpha-glucan branching enzyme, partial [Spirochaetes bacterium]|nr:1,4-alpha-glucan branching enzyme [Spirochaetota bacterium]
MMKTTITLEQINRIIYAYHWDPFEVLGYHEVKIKNNKTGVIRAFLPEAMNVDVIYSDNSQKMNKIHNDGMFEVILDKAERPD